MKNKFYLVLRMLTICSIFGITSTTIAQKESQGQTLFTKILGETVDSDDILYANQIFIEHKSFLKQNKDLNEVIRVIRMELQIEKNDGIRLRKELQIYKELKVDQGILHETKEIQFEDKIVELRKDNTLYKLIAVVSTVTAILVVIIK